MKRPRSLLPSRNALLIAAFLGAVVPCATARAAPASEEQIFLLAVFVNGRDTALVGEFIERNGRLSAAARELRALGFNVADISDDAVIALEMLPGVTYRRDERRQELHIDAPIDALALTRIGAEKRRGSDIALSRSTGALVNYDLLGTAVDGELFGTGLFEARLFGRFGVVHSGFLAAAGAGDSSLTRLDSAYSYADPERLRRVTAGDFISGGMPWSRSVRLGGLQFATDFGLRPDLITFPLPDIAGEAAVPSTIDVLVNGIQQMHRDVDPGPFAIEQLPVVTGAGTVTVVVREQTGQETVRTLPFYASNALLAPGLDAVSVEIGAVRKDFASPTDHYGRVAGAASFRYGVTPWFTWEAHGEATSDFASAGTGGVFGLGNFGTVSVAGSVSSTEGEVGAAAYASIERATPRYRLGASAWVAEEEFGDIAAMNGDPVPRTVLQVNGGVTLGTYGTLGIAFTHLERPLRDAVGAYALQKSSTLSATYGRQLTETAHFYSTAVHSFGSDGTTAVMFGLTVRLGERTTASVGGDVGEHGGSGHGSVTRPAREVGDYGYQLYARHSDSTRALAAAEYKSRWALVSGALDVTEEHTAARAGVNGAFAFLGGRVLASNRIQDSFALVDTSGIEGVKVLRENRAVGETDSRGQLLIPDLRSFQANKITIDPTALPLDADLSTTTLLVRPHDRTGVLAEFEIRQQHSAILALHDEKGEPLALGSTAVLQASGEKIPVGYDGLAYAVGLEEQNTLDVILPDARRCRVTFSFTPAPGTVPELGPFICQED